MSDNDFSAVTTPAAATLRDAPRPMPTSTLPSTLRGLRDLKAEIDILLDRVRAYREECFESP